MESETPTKWECQIMKSKRFFLNSLLFLSIGFLTLGLFLDANLHAGKPVYKSNDQLMQDEAGSRVQINSDGSKLIKKPDGTTVQVKPDGSKIIKDKDGTRIEVKADGTKSIKKSDGSIIDIRPGAKK
jgi:hypothetical protein